MRAFVVLPVWLLFAACGGRAPAPQTSEVPVTAPDVKGVEPTAVPEPGSLNGVWQLVSFEQTEPSGNVSFPYGEMPIGRLTFDAAGRMSVIVMKPGRFASVNSTAGIALASIDDLRQIADGFMAYYGSFTVDETTQTITTKVNAATIPAWTDSEQKRAFELSGDTLALITPTTKLTWTRLPN